MSIVDLEGEPVAYGWNDEAASDRVKADVRCKLISDEEFERLFPHLFRPVPPLKR